MPNPEIDGELISVQLCSLWALGFADPKLPVSEMPFKYKIPPSSLISTYKAEKFADR